MRRFKLAPAEHAEVIIFTTGFNIKKICVLPTQCINVFYTDLRTNSDFFPYTALTDWFYNRDGVCLLRGMD